MENIREKLDPMRAKAPAEALPIVAGWASFGTTLAISTWTQLKILGVSTGTRFPMVPSSSVVATFIPSSLGFATVCVASLASHKAAIVAHTAIEQYKAKNGLPPSPSLWRKLSRDSRDKFDLNKEYNSFLYSVKESWGAGETVNIGGFVQIPKHTLRICVVGLLAFKLLGGRCWGISPSSYTNIGSFARQSIPAPETYANPAQRKTIEKLGRVHGCHTCGSKQWLSSSSFKFVADHMPPKAIAKQIDARWYNRLLGRTIKFRFYPQCKVCSSRQGSIVLARKKHARFHGLRPRWNHVAGGIVAGVTVVGASDEEIAQGNPKRYRQLQKRAEECLKRIITF